MELLEQLNNDMKEVLKSGQKDKLTTIRMVKASIKNEEIRKKDNLTNEDIISIIVKEIKQRKDANEEFKKGNRQDLVDKNLLEIEWLNIYLPEQLDDSEVEIIIVKAFEEVKPSSMNDMGAIMKLVMPQVKGKADLGKVSTLIREKLSNL